MRKSLAPHARERMCREERWIRREAHLQLLARPMVHLLPADQAALVQRADRAERNAASWHRLAILLAVACALLLVLR